MTIDELAELVGENGLHTIAHRAGGQRRYVPKSAEGLEGTIWSWTDAAWHPDLRQRLISRLGGTRVTIPTALAVERRDARRTAARMLKGDASVSDAAVAKRTGLSRRTVGRIRKTPRESMTKGDPQ